MPKKDRDYVLERIKKNSNGCWLWQKHIIWNGYGQASFRNGDRVDKVRAHRLAYEIFKEAIPEGLVLDHLCRVRHCVNPSHLEAVTHKENIRRGETGKFPKPWLQKTECVNGHSYTPQNIYVRPDTGAKLCRKCRKETSKKYQLKLQGA